MKKKYIRGLAILLIVFMSMTLFSGAGWKQQSGVKNQMAKNVAEIMGLERKDSEIISVTFMNRKNAKGTDISARRDGSVVAWLKDHPGTKAKDLYIAANGKVIAPRDCSGLFEQFTGVQEINFNNCFDTSEVTNMSNMFAYCVSLSKLDLSSFCTKNVTDMSGMFTKCMLLQQLNVSSFDTSSVTDMSFMFYHCTHLKKLDVRNFNTKNVRDMSAMFETCYTLESLDLSNFHTRKDTDYSMMFWRCNSLKSLDIRNFDFSNFRGEGLEELHTHLFSGEVYAGIDIEWPEEIDTGLLPYTTILFGHYEQDGKKSGYNEMIEWLVLDVQGDKALLLSVDALDAVPFHKNYNPVAWEGSSLRSWLNDTFLETAFDAEEQMLIQTTRVDNSAEQGNEKWGNKDNRATSDKVFLLSCEEINRYFPDIQSRICKPTKYAISRGADVRMLNDGVTEAGWWWLRSPGEKANHAAYISFKGECWSNAVGNGYLSVRPAMWIDLDQYYTN